MMHCYPSEANSCSAMHTLHIYETQRFVAVSTGTHYWPISWARCVELMISVLTTVGHTTRDQC